MINPIRLNSFEIDEIVDSFLRLELIGDYFYVYYIQKFYTDVHNSDGSIMKLEIGKDTRSKYIYPCDARIIVALVGEKRCKKYD